MKNRFLIILAFLLFLGSLGAFLYPSFKTAVFRQSEKEAIEQYETYRSSAFASSKTSADEKLHQESSVEAGKIFPKLWDACVSFNETLAATQQVNLCADTLHLPSIVPADYGWEHEAFGYLSIPSADINVPLYLGANPSNLKKGAAILGQTSMPIGGKSTNCVIAGHRTWNGAVQFKGLEELSAGDLIYLTNPWETLVYQVTEIEIIDPYDFEKIQIQIDRDLLSLFTCTYPSTHRVLVTCKRINKGGNETNNGHDIQAHDADRAHV